MMDNEWKKYLRREASAHHMCEENRRALEEVTSKADAISLYKRTIDWALEEGYPSVPVLRKFFGNCELFGIYIDRHFNGEILDDQQVYVFHHCTGTIRTGLNVAKGLIPMLYFDNGCDMKVECAHRYGTDVLVPLYLYRSCRVSGERSEDMRCVIYNQPVKNGR